MSKRVMFLKKNNNPACYQFSNHKIILLPIDMMLYLEQGKIVKLKENYQEDWFGKLMTSEMPSEKTLLRMNKIFLQVDQRELN